MDEILTSLKSFFRPKPPQLHNENEHIADNIYFGKLFGWGRFGLVYLGYWRDNKSPPANIKPVAIKIFRNPKLSELMDISNEVSIMREIGRNKFVLGLIGTISASQLIGCPHDGLLVVTELCAIGSLESYLRKLRSLSECSNEISWSDSEKYLQVSWKMSEFLKWAYQIGCGMEYISSKKIIHMDLSARNVLLDERKNCKIGDFGLSLRYHLRDKVEKTNTSIPWRWAAPECFDDGKVCMKSDVWSYGVTLWEIFSTGEHPFKDLDYDDLFKDGITDGSIRLPRPELATDQIYDLMTECWETETSSRPTFKTIVEMMQPLMSLANETIGAEAVEELEQITVTRIPLDYPPESAFASRERRATRKASIQRDAAVLSTNFEIPEGYWNFREGRSYGNFGTHYSGCATVKGKLAFVRVVLLDPEHISEMEVLLEEIKVLQQVGLHPHIVAYVGACTEEIEHGVCYIATELCAGSLLEYLTHSKIDMTEAGGPKMVDMQRKLSSFCIEIVSGLEYLEKEHIVHVPKGTRGVLLDFNGTCKLTDFETSKYTPEGELPPESDPWRFGLTVWEIYSLGWQPYEEWGNLHTINFVRRMATLPRPDLASKKIYDQILQCWSRDLATRPTFKDLRTFFEVTHQTDYYLPFYVEHKLAAQFNEE